MTRRTKPYELRVPKYGLLIFRRFAQTFTTDLRVAQQIHLIPIDYLNLRKRTIVLNLGSTMAYVRSRRVFSRASLFSKPMSHETPCELACVGGILSLMIGMRARESILTVKLGASCSIAFPNTSTSSLANRGACPDGPM